MKDGPLMLLDRARDPKRPVLLNLLGQHLFLGSGTLRETLRSNGDSEIGRRYKMMCVCKEEMQMPPPGVNGKISDQRSPQQLRQGMRYSRVMPAQAGMGTRMPAGSQASVRLEFSSAGSLEGDSWTLSEPLLRSERCSASAENRGNSGNVFLGSSVRSADLRS